MKSEGVSKFSSTKDAVDCGEKVKVLFAAAAVVNVVLQLGL